MDRRAHQLMMTLLLALLGVSCANSQFTGDSHKIDKASTSKPEPGSDGEDGGDPNEQDGDKGDGGLTDDTDEANPQDIEIEEGETKVLALNCQEGDETPEIRLSGDGNKVQIQGEICPRAFGKLSVLFVVDFSGSMEQADPRSIFSLFNCGRSKAANAILKKIKDDMREGDEIQVGFISFGDSAKVETAFRPINDFSANTFNFCGFNNEFTNYKAALDLARQELTGVTGNKVIYFISDGLPTVGGAGGPDNNDSGGAHAQAGRDSATALKAAIQDLTFNAIFLNNGGAGTQAQSYLGELTGDASRVKLANGASQLAEKIVELSIPSVELDESTARAVLTAPGFSDLDVDLRSFSKKTAGVWEFKTETFELHRKAGETVDNLFTLTVKDEGGGDHKAELKLPLTAN